MLAPRRVKGNALGERAEEQAMTDIAWHNVIDRANGDGEFRGHFPMSEDPDRFRSYMLPILEQIRSRGG